MTPKQSYYQSRGFVVLPDVFPIARRWRDTVEEHRDTLNRVRYVDPAGEHTAGVGGSLHYDIGDGFWCDRYLRDIETVYSMAATHAERVVGAPLDLSPMRRSRYVVKVYPEPHGEQGWHFDTNGVTALLYLSTNVDACTRVRGLDHVEYTVFPRQGDLLLMQGRRCWHRADPARFDPKVVIPFNLYLQGEHDRPSGLDDIIYGVPQMDAAHAA